MTMTIVDAKNDIIELMPEGTYCIPLTENKIPLVKYSKKWQIPPEIIDQQIVDTTPAYGIRCDKIVCIDCDTYNDDDKDIPKEFRESTFKQTTGGGGLHYVFLKDDRMTDWKPQTKITDSQYDIKIGENSYFIGGGSSSTKGKYNVTISMPPQQMPDKLFKYIDAAMPKNIKQTKEGLVKVVKSQAPPPPTKDFKKLRNLLDNIEMKYLDNYYSWCQVGWIIHYETEAKGLCLFIEYSRKVEKYKNEPVTTYEKFWNNANVTNSSQLTIATLFTFLTPRGRLEVAREHKSFKRDYFHKLQSYEYDDDIEKANVEIERLKKEKNKVQFNYELNVKAKKKRINDYKDNICEKETQLTVLNDKKKQRTYAHKKNYFELFHFKLENPFSFGMIYNNNLTLYKKTQMTDLYENLYIANEKEFIKKWIKDADIKTYHKIDFLPYGIEVPADTYNTFRGFKIENNNSKPRDDIECINVIINHIDNLCGNEANGKDYMLDYFAHIIQKPSEKPRVAVVFKSDAQGVGKNLLLESFNNNILGEEFGMATACQDEVFSRFNTSDQKLILVMDEASGKESYMNSEKIKSRITCDNIYKEVKGFTGYNVRDYARMFFLSNTFTPVKVELQDRRFVIFDCNCDHANEPSYFNPLLKALNDKDVMHTFYKFLKDRDISNWNPINDRPITKIYKELQSVNVPITAEYLCHLVDTHYDEIEIMRGSTDLYTDCIEWKSEQGNMSRLTHTLFGRHMNKFNSINRKRTRAGRHYIIQIKELKEELIKKKYYEACE